MTSYGLTTLLALLEKPNSVLYVLSEEAEAGFIMWRIDVVILITGIGTALPLTGTEFTYTPTFKMYCFF